MKRLAVLILFLIPSAMQAISLAFAPEVVIVSGVSPGGAVVLVSIESTPSPQRQFLLRKRANHVLADEDRDGVVTISASDARDSFGVFWAAVDVTTGSFVVSAPGWQRIDLEDRGFDGPNPATTNRLSTKFRFVEGLVVRPSEGAWTITTGDGGPAQEGPPGNGVRRSVSSFLALIGEKELRQILPRDTILLLEPARLRFFAAEGGRP